MRRSCRYVGDSASGSTPLSRYYQLVRSRPAARAYQRKTATLERLTSGIILVVQEREPRLDQR